MELSLEKSKYLRAILFDCQYSVRSKYKIEKVPRKRCARLRTLIKSNK